MIYALLSAIFLSRNTALYYFKFICNPLDMEKNMMKVKLLLLVSTLLLGFFNNAQAQGSTPCSDSSSQYFQFSYEGQCYQMLDIRGWTVYMNKGIPYEKRKEIYTAISQDLRGVKSKLPEDVIDKLKKVNIWAENDLKSRYPNGTLRFPTLIYHPERSWLVENDLPVLWKKSVVIDNYVHYLRVRSSNGTTTAPQPAVLFHELSHAWHHQFIDNGWQNSDILNAYKNAKRNIPVYQQALLRNGTGIADNTEVAYAMENSIEYFAELSEAYFWQNDYQPFNKDELKTFDYQGYQMIEKLWD